MNQKIVITHAQRTPSGAFQGQFDRISSTDLGAAVIADVHRKSQIPLESISILNMGCVLQAGLGQAPARQAALKAGIHSSTACQTFNKVCGSGLASVYSAFQHLHLNERDVAIAGGMENMSQAPHLLPLSRRGYRFGHQTMLDHMAFDGLEDAESHQSMGCVTEKTAVRYNLTREDQDRFAIQSGKRAISASEEGLFKSEITPVTVPTRKGDVVCDEDETLKSIRFEKIPQLKPAFQKDGTITAATASSIADGAAAVMMMTETRAQELSLKPLVTISGVTTFSHAPEWFTLAPIHAMSKLLKQLSWEVDDVDVFEINEAFAAVPMAAMADLDIPHSKVNVRGGACALGHPIGASGTRILTTLIHTMCQEGHRKGMASICIGGGEAIAIALERDA